MKLIKIFDEAYRAFVGAFDTPISRRKLDDEYATDARQRLRDFSEQFPAAYAEAVALLKDANNYGVRSQMSDEWCARLDQFLKANDE